MVDVKEEKVESEPTNGSSPEKEDQEAPNDESQNEVEKVKTALLDRLREEKAKRVKAEKEVGEQPADIKSVVRNTLKEIEQEREDHIAQEKELLEKEMENLHETYGDFEEDGLIEFADEYGIQGQDGLTDWPKAIELYNTVQAKKGGPRIKMPKSKSAGSSAPKQEYDDTGKSLSQIAIEAKRER